MIVQSSTDCGIHRPYRAVASRLVFCLLQSNRARKFNSLQLSLVFGHFRRELSADDFSIVVTAMVLMMSLFRV